MELFTLYSTIISIFFFFLLHHFLRKPSNLPPGPCPWPVVGNLVDLLLLLRPDDKKKVVPLHTALAALSKAHGPLIHLRLGAQSFIVASSSIAAGAVLKTNDRFLSARHVPATYQIPNYAEHSLVWAPQCDDKWKFLRSLCRSQLFSVPSLAAGELIRSTKVEEMVDFLKQNEGVRVDIGEVAFKTIFDMFGNMVFSKDLMGHVRPEASCGLDLREDMNKSLEIGHEPNLEDYFPGLLGGWDLQGLRRKATGTVNRMYSFFDGIVRETMEGERKDDFLDAMINAGLEGFPLRSLLLDIFTAGTDTTTKFIEWTMAELVKNPTKLQTLRQELQTSLQNKDTTNPGNKPLMIKESDLTHLPYLQACLKESLRLHPPSPLVLRRASTTCQVMGYTIPAGSIVIVNSWAIGRDPTTWDDPLVFSPERFLGKDDGNARGMETFDMVPFGSGRRMCPGMGLANQTTSLVVASLVAGFEWSVLDGLDASELCMKEKAGLLLDREEPLVLTPNSIHMTSGDWYLNQRSLED